MKLFEPAQTTKYKLSLSCTQFMNAHALSLISDYRMVPSLHSTNLPRINLKAIVEEQKSLLFASAVSIHYIIVKHSLF